MNKYLEKIANNPRYSVRPETQLYSALDKAKKLIERKDPAHARYKIQKSVDRLTHEVFDIDPKWNRGVRTLEHLASSKSILDTIRKIKR